MLAIELAQILIGCVQNRDASSGMESVEQAEGGYSSDSISVSAIDSVAVEVPTKEPIHQLSNEIIKKDSLATEEPVKEVSKLENKPVVRSVEVTKAKSTRLISRLPRRIQCKVENRVVKGESSVTIFLTLLDSTELETNAHKDLLISVKVTYLIKNESYRDSILFQHEKDIVTYTLSIKHEGPLRVIFDNKELTGCELMLKSIDQKKQTGSLLPDRSVFQFASFQQTAPVVLVIPPTSILYKANGKQEAQITYSLEDPDNLWPENETARINVVAPAGLLSSNSVIIDRASLGVISLKSTQPGVIKVRSIAVTPGVKIDPVEVPITFVKDIDSFEVLMPDSLHLLEEGELVINLKSTGGSNATTDQDIPYSLAIEGSALRLEPKHGVVEKGRSSARLRVIPVSIGSSRVTISMENYLDKSSTVRVKFPTFLIFLALLGGSLGGLLSLFINKEKNYWKIVVSAVTGPMLMWVALYMGIGNLSPTIILNPISCFLIAFIGGWAGVAVINLMLRGFGLATGPQVPNNN